MNYSLIQRLARRRAYQRIRLGPSIVQTHFFDCDLLVRAHEEVGRNIIVGDFETDDLRHFLESVRDGDVVFDVGANVGAYCVTIARRFPTAQVFAFEPVPLNAALINTSLLANRITNVEVVQACVSDSARPVEFSVAEDSAYSSIIDTRRKPEFARVRCDAVTFDGFCCERTLRGADVVKIDVEGAELKVLQGGSALFSLGDAAPRLVMTELYDRNLAAFDTSICVVVDLMTSWRYRPYVLIDGRKAAFALEHHNKYYNVFFERR
jgi:FkbM family methyltransferase